MADLKELDRARERWRLTRQRMGQGTDTGDRSLGLARRMQDLSARLLILPGDPFATELSFNDEFWGWWMQDVPAPFGSQVHWTNTEPTVDAAVRYRRLSEKWTTYLALNRNGGVEIGCNPAWSHGEGTRFFGLVHTVGLVWIGASTQAESVDRFGLTGPWELTLILYETENAYLAGFGTGWTEPRQGGGWDLRAQHEPNIMIRRELDSFPESENGIRGLAFDIGARIEDAWGVRARRFLDRGGDMDGQFNPRLWRF